MNIADELIRANKIWDEKKPFYVSRELSGGKHHVEFDLDRQKIIIMQKAESTYPPQQEIKLQIETAKDLYFWLKPLFEQKFGEKDEDKTTEKTD